MRNINWNALSLNPKLAAFFEVLGGVFFIFWLSAIKSAIWFVLWLVLRLSLWLLLAVATYYPPGLKRFSHFLTLIVGGLGASGLMLFVDEWSLPWNIIGAVSVFMSAATFWFIPPKPFTLPFVIKPWRSFKLLLVLVGWFGAVGSISAAIVFQLLLLSWWPPLIIGVLGGLLAIWWWKEYEIIITKHVWAVAGMAALFTAELFYVVIWWPVGFMVAALLVAWWWYALWLLLRFNLSVAGLDWKKQWWFVVSNILLMVLYLIFAARWR